MSDYSSDDEEEMFYEDDEEFEEDSNFEYNNTSKKRKSSSQSSSQKPKKATVRSNTSRGKKSCINQIFPAIFTIRNDRQKTFKAMYKYTADGEVFKKYRKQDLNICFRRDHASANSGHWPLQAGIREITANALDAVLLSADPDFIGNKVPEFKGELNALLNFFESILL